MRVGGIELSHKESNRFFQRARLLEALLGSRGKSRFTRDGYNRAVCRGKRLAYSAGKIEKTRCVYYIKLMPAKLQSINRG